MSTPSQTHSPKGAAPIPHILNPDELTSVYSNSLAMSATITDLTIYFLEVVQIPGSGQEQRIKAIVTLPIMAASGLADGLQQVIKQNALAVQQTENAKAAANAKK